MIEAFESSGLRAVCEVLADTATGLKGSEIGRILSECGIEDPSPGITKRDRLFDALAARQNRDRCGSNVVAFILKAMDPVRYSREPALFQQRRDELNKVLAFSGLHLMDNGKLLKGAPARTRRRRPEPTTCAWHFSAGTCIPTCCVSVEPSC